MEYRKLTGTLGVLSVIGLVVLGAYGFLDSYVVDVPPDAQLGATLATLAVAALFVAALVVVGSRAGGWTETPYW